VVQSKDHSKNTAGYAFARSIEPKALYLGKLDARKCSDYLVKHKDQIVGNLILKQGSKGNAGVRYHVEEADIMSEGDTFDQSRAL
jgi:hypothetical protein